VDEQPDPPGTIRCPTCTTPMRWTRHGGVLCCPTCDAVPDAALMPHP
jgi:primosomal protein N'